MDKCINTDCINYEELFRCHCFYHKSDKRCKDYKPELIKSCYNCGNDKSIIDETGKRQCFVYVGPCSLDYDCTSKWKPIQEDKMKDIIQISEEQAREMIDELYNISPNRDYEKSKKPKIDYLVCWKEKGYIKQSALEKARISYHNRIKDNNLSGSIKYIITDIVNKFEKAIKEIEDNKNV